MDYKLRVPPTLKNATIVRVNLSEPHTSETALQKKNPIIQSLWQTLKPQ